MSPPFYIPVRGPLPGRGERGPPMPRLGAHVSASGGLPLALERARELKAEALQIFTRAPSRWEGRAIGAEEAHRFAERRAELGHPPVLAHDLYLTNLAAQDPAIRARSLDSLVAEVERCELLGVDGLVCHLGSHPQEQIGLQLFAEAIAVVLERTRGYRVPLWLETTAGQGSCLGHRFAHLRYCVEANGNHPRLGVCLDTCHVFAAGYDLASEEGSAATWAEFEREVGFERLKALHLNDSQKELGSRVDRHANIGQGLLGQEAFRRLLQDPRLQGLPMVLETPDGPDKRGQARDLRLLKRLRGKGATVRTRTPTKKTTGK